MDAAALQLAPKVVLGAGLLGAQEVNDLGTAIELVHVSLCKQRINIPRGARHGQAGPASQLAMHSGQGSELQFRRRHGVSEWPLGREVSRAQAHPSLDRDFRS